LSDQEGVRQTAMADRFNFTNDDLVIVPVVAVAVAVVKLLRTIFRLLVNLVDWLFPILLQVMRFPLFTLRIVGDGLAALARGVVRILPIGGARRAVWREWVSQYWTWLRSKISYKAFEEWLHHIFEDGMAWVFRKCRALTPRAALLVLIGAVLWLPISFAVATLMHMVLIAKALSLPAWMQLLHPVATVIAKSKLLVLPVYPAAWPQAKQHPMMQALGRFWLWLGTLFLVRKTGYRYRQMDHAAATAADALHHTSAATGLTRFGAALLTAINTAAARIGGAIRVAVAGTVAFVTKIPLLGTVVQRYSDHYDAASRAPSAPLSERTRGFFARWSVKFTAKYYEAKDRQETAKGHASA
jgi:hypothetical protein